MAGQKQTKKADSGKNTVENKNENKNGNNEQLDFLNSEIMIIALFFVAVVLFLSHFGLIGVLGRALRSLQLGLFGILGYAVPMFVFIGGTFLISNVGSRLAKIRFLGVFLAVLSVDALISLILIPDLRTFGIGRFYAEGWYGGFIGGGLGLLLVSIFGKVGSIIFFMALLIISIVIITGKSFVSFVKTGSKRTISRARSDMGRMMDMRRQRKLEAQSEEDDFDEEDFEEDGFEDVDFDEEYMEELSEYDNRGKGGMINLGAIDFSKKRVKHVVNLPSASKGEKKSEPVNGLFDAKNNSDFAKNDTENDEKEEPYQNNNNVIRRNPEKEKKRSDVFYGNIKRNNETPKYEDDIDEAALKRANEILARKEEIDIGKTPVSEEKIAEKAAETDFGYVDDSYKITSITGDDSKEFIEEYDSKFNTGINTVSNENSDGEQRVNRYKNTLSGDGERTLITAGNNINSFQKDANTSSGKDVKKNRKRPYVFPGTGLLNIHSSQNEMLSDSEYKKTAIKLQKTLSSFDVNVTVEDISVGPAVTLYELKPEQGVKVSKVLSLANDIKLALAASDIRIEAPIPGKSAIGIEVPNKKKQTVYLRELFESKAFKKGKETIGFAVGKDISGNVIVSDIANMPHVLIAGATGSGKSVCINTLIMSIIYKYSPQDVKLIMVDPKVVELSVYNGIPHLIIPVVTETKKAASALNWAVAEMGERYKKFAATGVRDLAAYNKRIDDAARGGTLEGLPEKLPKIVIIIDELADLMMSTNNSEVEDSIVRLAQLARACGIHLVIATQRPSVNVITGLIKANIPSRIAFAVSSGTDSRTIIDSNGAEKLLGKGDMLFAPYGAANPIRVQGAFVSDEEVSAVVEFLKNSGNAAMYDEDTIKHIEEGEKTGNAANDFSQRDELFEAAGRFIIEKDKASIGHLQRNFKIGFNRAARIMDQLASAGVVTEESGTKRREILMDMDEFGNVLQ